MTDPVSRSGSRLAMAGLVTAGVSVMLILVFLLVDFLASGTSPYIGAVTFLVLPVVLALGVSMIAAAIWIRVRRFRAARRPITFWDLLPWAGMEVGEPRRIALRMMTVGALSFPFLGVMAYQGYHFTESNEFCGQLCHSVMEPEYTAYQLSSHARVGCVDCHIGEGASWFVKSKISGIRQVFAVMLETYSRPIPPAIKELRPARETCEQCHWPAKFHGNQLVDFPHFESDEKNTPRPVSMLVRTGGADPLFGDPSGIHWHMALGFEIQYVATDEALQEIPWVRFREIQTGEEVIYRSDGKTSVDPPPEGTLRTLDCMDCHNRPTHVFRSPDRAINNLLAREPELARLPFAKREAVAVLSTRYATKDEALAAIRDRLRAFYSENYPAVWAGRREDIVRLIERCQEIYRTNFFPKMGSDWRAYPNNLGHFEYRGCFRCHEGRHVDDAGNPISHECNACHDFLVESTLPDGRTIQAVGQFTHPVKLEGIHQQIRCSECHDGGPARPRTCQGCHAEQSGFREGRFEGLDWLGVSIEADVMDGMVDCTDCHDLSERRSLERIAEACVTCHDDETYGEFVTMWNDDFTERIAALRAEGNARTVELLDRLERAGTLHNPDATEAILSAIERRAREPVAAATPAPTGGQDEPGPETAE
ncbi:MAG: cytochrome C [Acidobacteria bacterium]|nr:MAG: cytochrome C [Acidobacteriota bacterium]